MPYLSIINRCLEKLTKVFMVRKILVALFTPSSDGLEMESGEKRVRGESEAARTVSKVKVREVENTHLSLKDEDVEERIEK